MSNFSINIVRIAKDRKQCIDDKSIVYNIMDVINNCKDMNVHVVTYKGKQCIRYKKNCKVVINTNVKDNKVHQIMFGNNGKLYKMHIILEDATSANSIILRIIEYFALNNNIKIDCCVITAKGVSNIPDYISKYADKIENCIIVYDDLTEDTATKIRIHNEIRFIRGQFNGRVVVFKPRCIEECVLSFKYLTNEIVNCSLIHKQFSKCVNNYFNTEVNYIGYDVLNNIYTINGTVVNFGYYSAYLKENVTNIERLLADTLAQITVNNPYEFIKRANECWYKDCMTHNGYCILANILGIKRLNSKASRCNKLLINENKIDIIIHNSLFSCFYDALQLLLCKKQLITNMKTLNEVIECYI